jgi:N-formylglutamate amidohydrolase
MQMELACRGYIDEPALLTPDNWPTPYVPARAAPLRAVLTEVLMSRTAPDHGNETSSLRLLPSS